MWTEAQQAAINERDANLLALSAAAGAGKTAVLVERVLQKVLEGTPIDRLLIVTFTNAAANSMRKRIFERLNKEIAENSGNALLERQISLLPRANISTIHSFCQTLLRNNFYLLNIPANFTIIDENRAKILQKQAVDSVLQNAYVEKNAAFLELVDNFGGKRSDSELEGLICSLHSFSQAAANPSEWLGKNITADEAASVVLEGFYADVQKAACLLDEAMKFADDDKHIEVLEAEREFFVEVIGKSWDEIHDIMQTYSFRTMPRGASDETKKLRDKAKKIWNSHGYFRFSFARINQDIKAMKPQKEALCGLVEAFSAEFARLKRLENSLDFNDLEHLTIQLLGKNGEEVAGKFDEVYVDEFQDTNAAQARIFEMLGERAKVFIVGDIKQSIYRFRNAQPQIFAEKTMGEKDGERVLHLQHNFRSTPQVIEAVNCIFTKLFTDIPYHELIAGNLERQTPGNAAEIHIIERNAESDLTPIQREARLVGNKILEIKAQNPAMKFADIAILTRKAKGVIPEFVAELSRAGIPTISDDSAGFFAADDVQNIVALLRIIDNQWQDIPLISVMRSELFEWTDEELAKIRLKTPEGPFYEAIRSYEDEKCVAFVAKVEKYVKLAKETSLAELLDAIFLDHGLQRLTPNMQATRSFAAKFELEEKRSLSEFNAYLAACIENEYEFASPKVLAPSSDAVRIMTIHKSKGLEFGTVFLVGTGSKFNMRDTMGNVLHDFPHGIALKYVDRRRHIIRETAAHRMIALCKKNETISEELRILYVAITRAIEQVFIVGTCKEEPQENSFLNWLMVTDLPVIRHAEVPELPEANAETWECEAEAEEDVLEIQPDTPLKLSVSEVLKMDENDGAMAFGTERKENTHNHELKTARKEAAYRGTVVHFVMQNLDLSRTNSQREIAEQIAEMREKRMFGAKEEEMVSTEKIYGFFTSELGQRMKNSSNVKREVKFFTDLDVGEFIAHVQGVVDCFFEENGEIVVVDFKTGNLAAAKPQSKKQVELYSQALEKITGKKVKECLVYGGL